MIYVTGEKLRILIQRGSTEHACCVPHLPLLELSASYFRSLIAAHRKLDEDCLSCSGFSTSVLQLPLSEVPDSEVQSEPGPLGSFSPPGDNAPSAIFFLLCHVVLPCGLLGYRAFSGLVALGTRWCRYVVGRLRELVGK